MSFKSVLSDIGHGLADVFKVGVKAATAAEPIVDELFPGVAPLFNQVVTEAGKVEGLAAAAGAQSGTGPQKLQMVVQGVEGIVQDFYTAQGIKTPPTVTEIEAIVNAAVAFLNALPSSTPSTTAAGTTVAS